MKSTREDVAKLAGVSVVTVSCVLNNSRPVSQKTIEKVKNAVKEIDYHPDAIARSMVKGDNKQLSIIVNDIVNPVQGEVVLGFENAAIEKGYFVNICTASSSIDSYIRNFISRRNDGVYITAIPERFEIENLYKLLNNGIKIVISGNASLDSKLINHLERDFESGISEAIGYLKQLNHRKLAMISAFSRDYKYDNRVETFCKTAMQIIPNVALTVIEGNYPYPSDNSTGRILTRKLIESGNEFTVIFCTNDLMAYGCISELHKAGLRVPEDVSVIGVDDIVFSADFSPSLSTISYDKFQQGKKAFEMLYQNMENGIVSSAVSKTNFIIRESCSYAKK